MRAVSYHETKGGFQLFLRSLIKQLLEIPISTIVIGLKNSYFQLIHLPS